jgi:hypothetical protein
VLINFSAQTTDVASSFVLLGASAAAGPYAVLPTAIIKAGTVPGQFQATVSSGAHIEFYRIQRVGGSTPPPSGLHINSLTLSGGSVTILFTGSTSDAASAFTLLSSKSAAGPFTAATGANITATATPGVFKAVAPANGPVQFYRIQK